jgi:hypothetical protein
MFPFDLTADRRRPEPPAFADTVPACFRSEAFAEDLPEVPAPQPWLPQAPRRLPAPEPA